MTTALTEPGNLSFAHLAGVGQLSPALLPVAAKSDSFDEDVDDDKDKKMEDEDMDDERKKRDDETDDEHMARVSAMDEKDEKDDDDEKGSASALAARSRERARCAAIFSSPAAARNPVLAANLAFSTSLSRKESLALLEATPAPAAPGNPGRASRNPNVGAGAPTGATSHQAVSARWDALMTKAAPKKR